MKSKIILVVASYCLVFTLVGCDAFVRKFTRKPKTQEFPEEEMILAPEEYEPIVLSPGERYQQDFLFWKVWQDELIVSLQEKRSQKKQLDCVKQAIKNLENLRPLLKDELRQSLEHYIEQEMRLMDSIEKDIYGGQTSTNMSSAERIKRNILRDFAYGKIKGHLTE
ncbi:MAG: hypothetical protein AMJ95_10405 [Omnitrophica WOR_2 bacterium SM23_72]|nr:MAG: hypothetical protein AMJ95_10405 [Omnitrophica WOR_2 bacterium SM23_72]